MSCIYTFFSIVYDVMSDTEVHRTWNQIQIGAGLFQSPAGIRGMSVPGSKSVLLYSCKRGNPAWCISAAPGRRKPYPESKQRQNRPLHEWYCKLY